MSLRRPGIRAVVGVQEPMHIYSHH
jgi:hypothetical protein